VENKVTSIKASRLLRSLRIKCYSISACEPFGAPVFLVDVLANKKLYNKFARAGCPCQQKVNAKVTFASN
jgi:hypothetical protein